MTEDDAPPRPLRLVVVLAGGASLGAYEAGAVAALLVAVRALRRAGEDVHVDGLTGASAGALVAYLSAVVAQTGRDPVATLHRAWVDEVDADLLRRDGSVVERLAGRSSGPLGFHGLEDGLDDLWADVHRGEPLQDRPLVLHVSVTDLAGQTEQLDGPRGAGTVRAPTFVRDVQRVVAPGIGDHELDDLRDAVFASAANPGAFAPRLVDGRWSVDGAMVESRPLRRALASRRLLSAGPAEERGAELPDRGDDGTPLQGDAATLVLVIDPRSEDPGGATRWRDPDDQPSWLAGLGRALGILGTQALYDDVRDLLDDPRGPTVDVLDPSLLADEDEEPPALLSGDFLGDFGGFLDRDLRHADFVLGWATVLRWAEQALPALGVSEDRREAALTAVRDGHDHDWRAVNRGDARAAALDDGARLGLAKLAAEAVAAVGRTAIDAPLGAVGDLVGEVRRRLGSLLGRSHDAT